MIDFFRPGVPAPAELRFNPERAPSNAAHWGVKSTAIELDARQYLDADGVLRISAPERAPVRRRGDRRPLSRRWMVAAILLVLSAILLTLLARELLYSRLQSRVLSTYAEGLEFELKPGPSGRIVFPDQGPYDQRLGYAALPSMLERLERQKFLIGYQARVSEQFESAVGWGIYPIFAEKNQTGLQILDSRGEAFHTVQYPRYIYPTFDDIPPLVWQTLLYIENRNMLDAAYPFRNPAIEWPRFGRALIDKAFAKMGVAGEGAGASTLATQLEKLRHSPGGRTESPREKMRQMMTASVRSYRYGPETMQAQRSIVRDYLNAMPLAAVPGFGEVTGLGDGLWAWYSADVAAADELLRRAPFAPNAEEMTALATAYRQVLSLFLADRRPSYFLRQPEGRAALVGVTDEFLRILERDGIITADLRDAALAVSTPLAPRPREMDTSSFVTRKAVNAVRNELLFRLGAPRLYDLDHYDLTVRSTFNTGVQKDVSELLAKLSDPSFTRAQGLIGGRLLGGGDPASVSYAVVIYEATPVGNVVRVQADNFDGPFDINKGSKLELGSTAKLRTLVSYLQIVDTLYVEYGSVSPEQLRLVDVDRTDRLTVWTLDYLARNPGISRPKLLEAAMDRTYSAGTGERFFTGGGQHVFRNFSAADDGSNVSVRDAFRRSVNLVFIRMMRDVVAYHRNRLPGKPASILASPDDPRRGDYLARFAEREGQQFTRTFFQRYRGRTEMEMWDAFTGRHRLSSIRMAWAYRSVLPDEPLPAFTAFMERTGTGSLSGDRAAALYNRTSTATHSWQDRGYLAGVHPLELWTMQLVLQNPEATWADAISSGKDVRQNVYRWLTASTNRQAQNLRIQPLIEAETFEEIFLSWKRLGYPFAQLVPSYATSIGSSADRPDALAELVGIVLRGGMRYPSFLIEGMHFGADTPYETVVRRAPAEPVRVLSAEVADVVKHALTDVVEHGTAVRARGAVSLANGEVLTIGGKTGTGDNRQNQYASGGRLIGSQTLNRTATFVFYIGDRHFGVITAYVSGANADRFTFTSSLPTQVLRTIAPALGPLFESE
jgi:membrane peptidoglycan carboxypeptidase